MEMQKGIEALGFTKSYDLMDETLVIGEAYVKNGLTLCLKRNTVTLVDRMTGKMLLNEILNKNTLYTIKRRLN